MSVRTTTTLVQAVLMGDWDQSTDLTPFIDSASSVIDKVVTCAAAKGITITSTDAELMERWLSGFFYQGGDPGYTSRSTANKSGSFRDDSDKFKNPYLRRAALIDTSGCLTAIILRQVASIAWGGKTVPEQLTFDQRN